MSKQTVEKYIAIISVVIIAIAQVISLLSSAPPTQPTEEPISLGITNFDQIQLDGSTDPVIDLTGNCMDLDDAGTTSICADTDNQIDIEIAGSDEYQLDDNNFTVGDAAAEDSAVTYDGNAQDYYVALDDSADDLIIGLGAVVGTTGILYFDENQDAGIGGASGGAKLDVTGNVIFDGAADEPQLTVQGFTTQTNSILVVEESGGTNLFWVTNNGDAELNGTTPTLTFGDAGAEDTGTVFDGNAQDYYLALDDSADDLIIGLGAVVGTTGILYFDENQDAGIGGASTGAKLDVTGNVIFDGAADEIQLTVQGFTTQTSSLQVWENSGGTDVGTMSNAGLLDISGELNYGSGNLSILGFATAGQQLIYGTASVTGTLAAPHGFTTVTFCNATLGEDPTSGAGDAAMVTVAVSGNVCTLKIWQDDFVTAATETSVAVQWFVVGTP